MQLLAWLCILGGCGILYTNNYVQSWLQRHQMRTKTFHANFALHENTIFVFFIENSNTDNISILYITNIQNKSRSSPPLLQGYDARYANDSHNATLLHNIENYINIQKLLNILENPHTSQHNKLNHLAEDLPNITLSNNRSTILREKVHGPNLAAGGLYDEWNFEWNTTIF